jgi:N-acetylglutamate synthase
MTPDADKVAEANAKAWEHLAESVPGGFTRRGNGALAVVTGLEMAAFNGVFAISSDVDVQALTELLDVVAAAGAPYSMQLRPGWPKEVEQVTGRRRLERVPGEPVMVLTDDRQLARAQAVDGLTIRQVERHEGGLLAEVSSRAFDVLEHVYRRLLQPEMIEREGRRSYLGIVDGTPVATSIGVTVGESVGVFGVGTLPAHRRRGYGAALTARAVSDGFRTGARWAWLSSSEAGFGVYRSLGFETIESWDFWEVRSWH